MNKLFFFIVLVSSLSFVSFWKVLTFHFWRDDWAFLWMAQHQPFSLLTTTLHPATWMEDILLFKVFGWNPAYWNLFGILLRIIAALSFALMMWGLSKSKNVTFLSGLFFAVSYTALESVGWSSVHVVPITSIFLCLGFYFWFLRKDKAKLINTTLTTLFLSLGFLADPGRSAPAIILLLSWEVLYFLTHDRRRDYVSFIYSLLIVINTALFIYLFIPQHVKAKLNLSVYLHQIINDPTLFKYFFTSIGNLFFGWIVAIYEFGSTGVYNRLIAWGGAAILIVAFSTSIYLGFIKRSKFLFIFAWLILWTVAFYIPHWFFNLTYIATGSHRYFGISGLGMVGMAALLIGSLRNKKLIFTIALLFILINIVTSNRILKQESSYRSIKIVDKIWDKVAGDVPVVNHSNLFMFSGDYYLKQSIIDWAGETIPWPYIVKLGIDETKYFPRIIKNKESLLSYICQSQDNLKLEDLVSNLYVWNIGKDSVENISKSEREIIRREILLKGC